MILLIVPLVFAWLAPKLIAKYKAERAQLKISRQLRESLQLLVNCLRTGGGLMPALDYISKEVDAPLSGEWNLLLQSVRLGQSWSAALDQLSERVTVKEMRWFVAAVQITQSTGGSLAEVLETLSATLQEQQTLRDKVSALTAQGKASGIILSTLPFFILFALELTSPAIVRPMFTTWVGQCLLVIVMMLLTIGGLVIRMIVSIKVEG